MLAGMLLAGGCPLAPPDDDAPVPAPRFPEYIEILSRLGIWQEINRVAQALPPSAAAIPAVDGEPLHEVQTLRDIPYRTTPAGTLTLNVHRPIAGPGPLRRAVVLFYGGGFVANGDFETTETWSRFFAQRGLVAFNVRYRLLTDPGVTLRDVLSDAIAAVRFVVAEGGRYGADPARIATLGRSSGGQMALLAGMVADPELFGPAGDPAVPVRVRAIVEIFSSTDDARLYLSDEFTLVRRSVIAAAYGGTPAQVPELYRAAAPLSHVRPGLPATLIIHGALDTTVPIAHAIRLADALEAAGNTVQRAFQPDTGHVLGWGLLHNEGLGRALQVIVPFLEEQL